MVVNAKLGTPVFTAAVAASLMAAEGCRILMGTYPSKQSTIQLSNVDVHPQLQSTIQSIPTEDSTVNSTVSYTSIYRSIIVAIGRKPRPGKNRSLTAKPSGKTPYTHAYIVQRSTAPEHQ